MRHVGQGLVDLSLANARHDPENGLITKKFTGIGIIDALVSMAVAMMATLDKPQRVADATCMSARMKP